MEMRLGRVGKTGSTGNLSWSFASGELNLTLQNLLLPLCIILFLSRLKLIYPLCVSSKVAPLENLFKKKEFLIGENMCL